MIALHNFMGVPEMAEVTEFVETEAVETKVVAETGSLITHPPAFAISGPPAHEPLK
jgi:hypothetical protein